MGVSPRVVFMGTPEFSVPTLSALLENGCDVVAVYTQPPRPVGRGHKMSASSVHKYAEERGLSVHTPVSLKDSIVLEELKALKPDVIVVVAYGLLLPKEILQVPSLGCFNVHASLLPRWRGAAPIQRAILAGDLETGVTIMHMEEGLDTGPMFMSEQVDITPTTTAQELHGTLSLLGGKLMVTVLDRVLAGQATSVSQPQKGVTYANKLARSEGEISWNESAVSQERKVRAFTPWPGTWFDLKDLRVKVFSAEVVFVDSDARGYSPGTIIDGQLTILCADGQGLRIKEVQKPGGSRMKTEEFLRGTPISAGTVLK
ncbi:MAG: methionyl-tRNA formyltransferase, partial [Alphaproteobacteria bacterium]|nr:methionyl-tRNA formyltransferase [Alphaproteobacteria bacterium]